MVLNVVGSNPTGHPLKEVDKTSFFCVRWGENPKGFVIDEVAGAYSKTFPRDFLTFLGFLRIVLVAIV